MTEQPQYSTADTSGAGSGQPMAESGASGVESRSGVTRNRDHRLSCRRPGRAVAGANRAVLSPGGTFPARKITKSGPGAGSSSSPGGVSVDQDAEAAARVERLRVWARGVAASFPPWSDGQWQEVNAALGYRLRRRE